LAEVADLENRVFFYSGSGLRLAAILETPDSTKNKYPGIVLCQGPGGVKEVLVDRVSHYLAKAGYAALRFDYRGVGESEGIKNRLIPMEQVEDVRNAITWLQQQPGVDPSRIGLWGAATGGANVSYVSAFDRRVRCMVSVNGMGDIGAWFRGNRRYWEWLEFLKRLDNDRMKRVKSGESELVETSEIFMRDPASERFASEMLKQYPQMRGKKSLLSLESAEALMDFKPVNVVDRISPRAAMWICAGLDTLLPIEQSIMMYEKAGEPKDLLIIENAEHHALYSGEFFERVMSASVDWFDSYLKKSD
jgi:dipeptidyl aminopeptidase/acylaminoacyl peptidase